MRKSENSETILPISCCPLIFSEFNKLKKSNQVSGISKPRFCQTYVLQFGAFHENDGNENDENDEDNSDSHKQGGWLPDSREITEMTKTTRCKT